MTSESPGAVVVCGVATFFAELSAASREYLVRTEGPYETITCPLCERAMMLSRPGREALASGQATHLMCSTCLGDSAANAMRAG